MTIETLYKTFFGLLVKFLNQLIKLIEIVNGWYVIQQQQAGAQKQHLQQKQAEAKMTQAQLKLDLAFTSVYLYQINEQEILLAGLTLKLRTNPIFQSDRILNLWTENDRIIELCLTL